MATHRHYFEPQQFIGERRQKPRIAPELLTYVSFGGDNGGMVLDVSEGGLAVATAFAIPEAALVDIAIPTDAAHERIEVTARVAWVGESKRRVGVEFVGASQDTREALRKWIHLVQDSESADIASANADVEVRGAALTNLEADAPTVAAESGLVRETTPAYETSPDVPEEIPASHAVIVEPVVVVAAPEQSVAAASSESAEAAKPQIAVQEAPPAEHTEDTESVPVLPPRRPLSAVEGGVGDAGEIQASSEERAQSEGSVATRAVATGTVATGTVATGTGARRAAAQRIVAEKLVGESPRGRERPLPRSRETETVPGKAKVGTAKDAGKSPAAPGVEKGKTSKTERMRKFPLVAAFVLTVLAGFVLGIVIGRSVLGRGTHDVSAAKQRWLSSGNVSRSTIPAQRPSTSESEAKPDARASVDPHTNAGSSAPRLPLGSDKGRQADASNAPANAGADATVGTPGNKRGSPVAGGTTRTDARSDGAQAAKAPQDRTITDDASAENSSIAATAGRAVLVTPNEGGTPLRVELGEEVIAQSPSLEIRASRFAMIAGAGSRKARKERLAVGPMISRVTPQPPASALASVPRNGELVVVVRVTIAGDGRVVYVDPLSGPIALIPSVMTAVREWKYQPSLLDGEPAETQVDLTLTFRAPR